MNSELFTTIKEIALAIGIIFPNLTLLWKSFSERKKTDPQVKLIRNKALQEIVKVQRDANISKIKVQSEAKLTKLKIEEAAIKEEVKHFARIRNIENGVVETPKEPSTDFLSSLKQKGTDFFKDKVGSVVNEVDIDKLTEKLGKTKEK